MPVSRRTLRTIPPRDRAGFIVGRLLLALVALAALCLLAVLVGADPIAPVEWAAR